MLLTCCRCHAAAIDAIRRHGRHYFDMLSCRCLRQMLSRYYFDEITLIYTPTPEQYECQLKVRRNYVAADAFERGYATMLLRFFISGCRHAATIMITILRII